MRRSALLFFVLGVSFAHADGLIHADYYALSGINSGVAIHPDAEHGIEGGIVTGLVQDHLGPDGLPVASAYGLSYSGVSGPITDVDASNQILWWTPHTLTSGAKVATNGFEDLSLPIHSDEYAFGAGDDGTWYRTAHMQATFQAAAGGTATFSLGSDDDAWVYLNGTLIVDAGGVHGSSFAPTTVSNLAIGTNKLDVFFADRHTSGSRLDLDADVTLNPVPEPASCAGLAVGAFALLRRRRARN